MSDIPYRIPDNDIVDAVREAYESGTTDAIDGGVPPNEVANRLDVNSTKNISERLDGLVKDDKLIAVLGVEPDSWRRRVSYICIEHSPKSNKVEKADNSNLGKMG